ncbi:uncharacterized protein [Periplaneta americana]|uniref:uncharacterized protein n=1 Tax=Periplaneta americana TaxID=6978 RepID=UPI0037E7089F
MNFSPFGGHFPAMHQFAAAKFSNEQIQAGTMLVTSSSDGTIQYIRPEHNGANFFPPSANSNPVQAIPVSIATSGVNVPVTAAARGITTVQQQQQQQPPLPLSLPPPPPPPPPQNPQQHQQQHQQQLAAMVNQSAGSVKYHHPPGTLLSWGEVPLMHHFNEAGKNITINVPYPNPAMNSATILAVQPTQTPGAPAMAASVWPVRLMQNVATMTVDESELQPQDLCKGGEGVKTKSDMAKRDKDSGESDDESDDSTKSDAEGPSSTSEAEQGHQKQAVHVPVNMTNGGHPECHQIQLQQQGSAMADYLARLQPSTIPLSLQHFLKYQTNNVAVPEIKREGDGPVMVSGSMAPVQETTKKKKKKKSLRKPPRPKPGEIRLSTALDGSTLFCCPECYMAYPDRDMLEQHLAGHKQERRFVCNVCGAGLKRKEHLDQHKRGHSDERPFVCTVCMKGFKRNEHLTRHYVIHSGNKNHACVECGKAFSRKDHLHKHAQTHIAKRVKAELSQAASTTPTPPITPHALHQQPLTHPLHLHHPMS